MTRRWTLLLPCSLLPAGAQGSVPGESLSRLLLRFDRDADWQAPAGQAADRAWLAGRLGIPGSPAPTAPYAWHAGSARSDAAAETRWIGHLDPVRMLAARDRFHISPCDDLAPAHMSEMFTLAREAAHRRGCEIAERAGRWYLLSDRAWDLASAPLDSAQGRDARARLPTGADARAWRLLADEISMAWFERVREDGDAILSPWLHGAGPWRPALPAEPCELRSTDPAARGWLLAGQGEPGPQSERIEFDPAHAPPAAPADARDWQEALSGRILASLGEARREGFGEFVLVLCGARTARVLRTRPRRPAWLDRWRSRRNRAAWLIESPPETDRDQ
jgi:hypothetical protein